MSIHERITQIIKKKKKCTINKETTFYIKQSIELIAIKLKFDIQQMEHCHKKEGTP